MSVTTRLNHCLHPNHLAERSYCCHITPCKPDSELVLESRNDTVDDDSPCIGTTPLYPLFPAGVTTPLPPLLSDGVPPVKNWLGSMIRRRRADSARRLKLL